jgi:hypothetical protein
MILGLVPSLLYLSLNKGYQSRFNNKRQIGVQYNSPGKPVDFDVTKYVKPFSKEKTNSKVYDEELVEMF